MGNLATSTMRWDGGMFNGSDVRMEYKTSMSESDSKKDFHKYLTIFPKQNVPNLAKTSSAKDHVRHDRKISKDQHTSKNTN